MTAERALVGLDVGSTTVKGVVVDPATSAVLWSDYVRHETRQPETVLGFLDRIEATLRLPAERLRVLVTGSGGAAIASRLGTHHVQEVTAVALAVERLHPEAGSVVELGGQDAKIIIFRRDPISGRTSKTMSMNDKCAGGTGAVLDKILAKLGIRPEQVAAMKHRGVQRHPVAAKCGVFAETDINALQKVGVPADQLLASLFDAIVTQNLSVLARGNTLRPEVLLLGGPNAFVPGLVEAWREHIPRLWAERGVPLPADADPRELVRVPADALYFGALGAVEFGRQLGDGRDGGRGFAGSAPLRHYVTEGRRKEISSSGRRGLAGDPAELAGFLARYRPDPTPPVDFTAGSVVEAYLGIDGGSTSTKGVLLAPDGAVLGTAYRLSRGNPIDDTRDVLERLDRQVTGAGATLRVLGVGTTGYAKDVLGEVLRADVALVETVAHARSALRVHPDADVICDVGGQDIKVIVLRDGRVVDFRLNTQCSAGNGYFLQAVSGTFGVPVERYADLAFAAKRMPTFGYGCAVFLQSDIVDVQRQGWRREEIMAGLAAVLPKNIWLYVAQTPNLAALGRTFVLQGGTQHNLAAVKAQVDYIESRFAGTGVTPRVVVHRHCGEAGAIGAALEAGLLLVGRPSSFVGMTAVRRLTYTSHTGEDTRCPLCRNHCLRTYLRIEGPAESRRVVVGNGCERGAADEGRPLREINRATAAVRAANPNLAGVAARAVWRAALAGRAAEPVTDRTADPRPRARPPLSGRERRRREQAGRRDRLRIGIPRALGLYSANPFFTGYLGELGVPTGNLVYSDFTSDRLYRTGVQRGSIDPCFPSKLGIPHVHDLLTVQHRRRPLDVIFFPMLDALPGDLVGVQARRACPTVTLTPQAVRAAFVKEGDAFAAAGIRYLNPLIDLADERLCAAQLFDAFADLLGLTRAENDRAVRVGYQALRRFWAGLRSTAAEVLARLEAEQRLGIVVLGRPYHHDPGINHGILDDLQKAGYPVLTQDTLPVDGGIVERLFGAEVAGGAMAHPLDISDVWECSYSENTNRKLWAAKFVARHPNLVAVELSSFKCGHDAPTYAVLAEILEASGTPYLSFRDIDENKPASSIRLRIETITYLLGRYREEVLVPRARARAVLDHHLAEYEARLRIALTERLDSTGGPHERTLP